MYSRQYILCLHYNIIMKFMPRHRGQIAVENDTIHESVCLSVTEKNDRATYFPNAPRMIGYMAST